MSLLNVTALHKYYGDNHVLKGIDLKVEEGEVVAIIGRSGSGKSTFLRTLNGLESINDGVIEVDGEYIDAARADLRSLRQKVGMVFQQFNLFPHLSVGENVMLAPQVVKKTPRAEVISSHSNTLGDMARARAMATRCCWPPERRSG
jgi:polar amino acid transport system ATP-binding protein